MDPNITAFLSWARNEKDQPVDTPDLLLCFFFLSCSSPLALETLKKLLLFLFFSFWKTDEDYHINSDQLYTLKTVVM